MVDGTSPRLRGACEGSLRFQGPQRGPASSSSARSPHVGLAIRGVTGWFPVASVYLPLLAASLVAYVAKGTLSVALGPRRALGVCPLSSIPKPSPSRPLAALQCQRSLLGSSLPQLEAAGVRGWTYSLPRPNFRKEMKRGRSCLTHSPRALARRRCGVCTLTV
eukprot:GHVT01078633.1.p1 GENE.GHVT01078633.1~~GHVT01078633.1.p1  ORF type:complete len:163 (-),score=14.28 GHVT01078633.1:951-1439(-)